MESTTSPRFVSRVRPRRAGGGTVGFDHGPLRVGGVPCITQPGPLAACRAGGSAEAGAVFAVVARDEKKNEDTLAELRGMGANAIAVTANVAERSDLEAMLATVTDELGPVDVLVNNAGIGFHADALTLDDADWRRIFDTNLDAVWMASQIVGRQMVARKAGSILNSRAISGFIVNRPQWHSAYGISKAAVHHLTKSLAAEWASKGGRVNAIAPGYVKAEIANRESA